MCNTILVNYYFSVKTGKKIHSICRYIENNCYLCVRNVKIIVMTLVIVGIFLNLLPVPLLDGGLFLLTLLEEVYGKKLPEKSLYYIQALGVTVIAFLFLLAMFNDISSIFK